MVLARRYTCVTDDDGFRQCYDDDSFWYTDKGIIIKWVILTLFFLVFFGWFVGGYIHAKQRLRKGLPLLAYHRFLVSYSTRRRHGQAGPPQNHFTFYQTQNPYQPNPAYAQRQDGAWAEPPPLYQNTDAPPQYYPPPGATKMNPNQGQPNHVELPQYGVPGGASGPQGAQQSGVVGAGAGAGAGESGDVEQGSSSTGPQELPARPETAKTKLMSVVGRFRR
ncbi:hypothetical protein NX059_003651 [Plenodomus lindquistii]|nr:hypothetical protein NX059_003651 [Plenodomus lindquistii]